MGRDRETAGPIGQARGHGAVEGSFGIEMAGFGGELGGEYAGGGGGEGDVGEEEGVDGAVLLHRRPVVFDVEEWVGWWGC